MTKEVFIYNETYFLPTEAYKEFKSRVSSCGQNPMCLSKVKYDAENFIAQYGKANGDKFDENGKIQKSKNSESSYVELSNVNFHIKPTSLDALKYLLVLGLFVLTYYSIQKKIFYLAIISVIIAVGLMIPKDKLKQAFSIKE